MFASDLHKARAILKNINWDFYQKSTFSPYEMQPFKCSTHHWWPATFVPEIPFTLIEVLTLPNAVVYDPFAGIGTTYFQALLLNRRPLATEICKVSVDFMRSLFVLFDPKINIAALAKKIESIPEGFNSYIDYTSDVPGQVLIDKLRPWYSPNTLNQLSFLLVAQANCDDVVMKAAMRISISAILKTASSQDRGWGCIADNVLPKQDQIRDKEVLTLFSRHSRRLLNDISEHLGYVRSGYDELYRELSGQQTIFHSDARECLEISDNSVDLVVTSPPYPNMTDYVNSQRLSYYFIGSDLSEDSNLEIGATSRRQTKGVLDRYVAHMQSANEMISRKLKSGGYACYVMPVFSSDNENNSNRRRIVQRILSKIEEHDLIREEDFERILPARRRVHNAKWATLEREKVYLFRKV